MHWAPLPPGASAAARCAPSLPPRSWSPAAPPALRRADARVVTAAYMHRAQSWVQRLLPLAVHARRSSWRTSTSMQLCYQQLYGHRVCSWLSGEHEKCPVLAAWGRPPSQYSHRRGWSPPGPPSTARPSCRPARTPCRARLRSRSTQAWSARAVGGRCAGLGSRQARGCEQGGCPDGDHMG
jgi:hypothetical protein